jgi:Fe2+ or Zn2+ uptake regulation protein
MQKAQELSETIRYAGFRATRPRIAVLSFLKKTKFPIDIQAIAKGIGREKVDQVTVYRILEAFKKAGIVVQVDFQHGRAYYELKDETHDHHHVVCTSCEKIEDFTGCDFDALAGKAMKQTKGFAKITDHSFELFGLCNACAKA